MVGMYYIAKDVMMFNEKFYYVGGQFQEAKKTVYIFLRS